MIGLDTNVLVARVIAEHPDHEAVKERLVKWSEEGRAFAIGSVILSEFVHVVTDPKRFDRPLSMKEALRWAELWSRAREVHFLLLNGLCHEQWLAWLDEHKLGRKRLIDTLIAAMWYVGGVKNLYTLNPGHFRIFGVFEMMQ